MMIDGSEIATASVRGRASYRIDRNNVAHATTGQGFNPCMPSIPPIAATAARVEVLASHRYLLLDAEAGKALAEALEVNGVLKRGWMCITVQ